MLFLKEKQISSCCPLSICFFILLFFPPDQPLFSATKWVAGMTMLQAVAAGKISLNDNPQKYLSFWTNDPNDPRSKITLQNLLSLTTGFADGGNGNFPCLWQANWTTVECVKQIYENTELRYEPGSIDIDVGQFYIIASSSQSL